MTTTSSFMSTAATLGSLALLLRIAFVGLAMFVSSYCVTFLSLCACRSCRAVAGFGSDAVSKQMSDKLQFVAQSDKLKHVGHQTASLLRVSIALTEFSNAF